MTIATWGDLLVKKEYKMTMPILQNRYYTLSVAGTMGRNSVVAMLGNHMVIGRLKNNTITFKITDFTSEDTIVLICPEGGSITHAQLERGNKATDWTPAPEDAVLAQNKKVYNPVRYIRDWLKGSSADTSNRWYEIMANDTNGTNVAQGKRVTTNGTASNLSVITNGLVGGTYSSTGTGKQYVEVDLGSVHYNIASVSTWHYYLDNRTYYETRTEVSEDRINWYPIFDSLTEGTYAETASGKTYPNTRARSEALISAYHMSQQLATSTSKVVINGGNITAGTVKSANSDSWINLDNGQFSFGKGNMVWNGSNLTVKGNIDAASINTGTLATSRIPNLSADKITVGTLKDKNNRNNINLDTGTFSLANGNIAYNGSTLEIKSGVTFSSLDSAAQTKINNGEAAKKTLNDKASLWDAKLTDEQVAAKILADKKIIDTRTTNQAPDWYFSNYPNQLVREFKNVSVMGVGSGTYGVLTTDVPWSGNSGGSVKQTFKTNTEEFKRDGTTTSWTAWVNHDAMAAGAKTLTDKWAFKGKTTINGGQIEADTITAAQIEAGSITAELISSDAIVIGSRNYFTKNTPVDMKVAGSSFVVRGTDTPNGFRITGVKAGDTSVRIPGVITSNGWWTVSFDVRGNQGTNASVTVDICDKGAVRVASNATNTYERRAVSVYVDNYSSSYNFVDFDNFDWKYFLIDNIKVEKGNKATDWAPAPEDVFIDLETEGSTIINGGNITTGYISADFIKGGTIATDNLVITDNENNNLLRIEQGGTRELDATKVFSVDGYIENLYIGTGQVAAATTDDVGILSEQDTALQNNIDESNAEIASVAGKVENLEGQMNALDAYMKSVDANLTFTGNNAIIGNASSKTRIAISDTKMQFYVNNIEIARIENGEFEFLGTTQMGHHKITKGPNNITTFSL